MGTVDKVIITLYGKCYYGYVQVTWEPREGMTDWLVKEDFTEKVIFKLGTENWVKLAKTEKKHHEEYTIIQGFLEMWFDVAEKWGEWKAKVRVKK